jgi:hypothetical protein
MPLILVCNDGISAIYWAFALMYYNANAKKKELSLTDIEVFETWSHIYIFLYPTFVGVFVIVFGLVLDKNGVDPQPAMTAWALMGGMGILGFSRKKIFKKRFGKAKMAEPHLADE